MSNGPCLCGDPECVRCFPSQNTKRCRPSKCAACHRFLPSGWAEDTCDRCHVPCADCGEPSVPQNPRAPKADRSGICPECYFRTVRT